MSAAMIDIPRDFWKRLLSAPHRLLMTDYDGTLAPIRMRPEEATPLPEILTVLGRIAATGSTTVAIVSGRPLASLTAMVGACPFRLVGEHGWEWRAAGGAVRRHPLPGISEEALAQATRLATARGWLERLEWKRTGVVLHTRGLPEQQARYMERTCAALWEGLLGGTGLRLVPIHGGIELRAVGHDKGTAAMQLIAESPAQTFPVYLGDDTTDEDAFVVVSSRGLAVRVGSDERPTAAVGRLESPESVKTFLGEWAATFDTRN